jgi:mevalonate pyrophosphate decarboxylase
MKLLKFLLNINDEKDFQSLIEKKKDNLQKFLAEIAKAKKITGLWNPESGKRIEAIRGQ